MNKAAGLDLKKKKSLYVKLISSTCWYVCVPELYRENGFIWMNINPD